MSNRPLRRSVVSSPQTVPFSSRIHSSESQSFHESTSSMKSEAMVGEQRIIGALIGRLVNKLPCNSGARLGMMEVDAGIQATVQSLLQLARIRLPLVVHALSGALETLSKYSSTSSLSDTPLDTLHSQLYLLHILHLSLSTSWKLHSLVSPPPPSEVPRAWPDPVALEDSLARNLLAVLMVYTRLVSSDQQAGAAGNTANQITGRTGKVTEESWSRRLSRSSSSYTLGNRYIQQHSYPSSSFSSSSSITVPSEVKLLASSCTTAQTTIIQMTKYTARAIFYLSSSNWSLVFSRLKLRVAYFTTTIDETPDLSEIRMLEWSNVNRQRLAQTIQEISTVFLNVKRPAQVAIAVVLREAIWNWINVHPSEYGGLIETNQKLEQNVDNLFDVLGSMSDAGSSSNIRRTRVYYPLMAMLLVISPDTFKKVVMGEMGARGGSGVAKKASFLDNLRKGVSGNKGFEAALASCVDLVKAATCLSSRVDGSGIKSLVPDVENDMMNAIFSNSTSDLSDPDMLVDGLVALYRSGPGNANATLFPRLWSDPHDTSKMLAVRACIAIISDDGRLPWHPRVAGLREMQAGPIQSVFKKQVASLLADRATRSRNSPDLPSLQTDLVCEILELFILDPTFATINSTGQEGSDQLSQLLSAISSLTVTPSPLSVRLVATQTVKVLISHINADVGSLPPPVVDALWRTLVDACRQCLNAFHAGDSDGVNAAASAFKNAILGICQCCESHPEVKTSSAMRSAVLVASLTALTGLTGPDIEQTTVTNPVLPAIGRLLNFLRQIEKSRLPDDGIEEMVVLQNVFKEISKLPPATGRQQQQRQLRRVVKAHCQPSSVWNAVWLGLATRVNVLSAKIAKIDSDAGSGDLRRRGMAADIEGLEEDESKEWQNLVFFLCATASVCLIDTSPPTPFVQIAGPGILPRLYENVDTTQSIDTFIRKCVDQLNSQSIHVRESVKDALGNELPPSLGRILVVQMAKLIAHSIEANGGTCSAPFTTFVEQAISVLRLQVDRMQFGETTGSIHVDMGELMFILAQYIHRLGRDDVSLRVKIRYCQLVEVVLQKSAVVVLSNSSRLRNSLLEWISEWSTDVSRDLEGFHIAHDPSARLQRELDIVGLRAIVHVTEGLVLRAPGDDAEETQTVVKSRLFYRHYQHFVRVLGRTTSIETDSVQLPPSISTMNHPRSSGTEDAASLAILALSNLLAANIDVGLKHCLTLGYHVDATIRTAFMQLLCNILQQGTKFNGLTAQRTSSAPKAYLELMTSSNLALVAAVCEAKPSAEIDEIVGVLFRAFEARGSLLPLMRLLIEYEVSQTNQEAELFRSSTLTTRMMALFAKTYGYNYIRATIQPFMKSFLEKPAECSFELDPSKASGTDDIEKNADRLKLTCQALLDQICSSGPPVPIMFRALCYHIWDVVIERFPASTHSAVGSFMFLRFICPALIQPETIDVDANVENQESREVRRGLLLITKVVQNLANNVVFGAKEQHMKVLNTFLSENIRQVTQFLAECAVRPRTNEISPVIKAFQEEAERSADVDGDDAILHRFIYKNLGKLESSLNSLPASYSLKQPSSARSGRQELDGKGMLENLKRAMEVSGPPADNMRLTAPARSQVYDEFMRHNKGRNTESVSAAFYEGPASQNGRRIFYFIVARVALVDYDLLAYHVFLTLDKITDFFDLVIDLTDFSAGTELPAAWIRRSLQMCPPGILTWVHTLALYNPNSYAKKRSRRLIAELAPIGASIGQSVVAASSPTELAESIPFTSLALPEFTMALAYQSDYVFPNLLCLSDHEQQVPVVVKLGHDCLQVASWRKQDLTSTIKAYIIDVIRLKDIDDIILGTGLSVDTVVIKHSQTEAVTFTSGKRNEMVQIIRAARARLRDAPLETRALRPSDVPGTLLNVALLNLSSEDEMLRVGAYNLVVELSQFFRYELITRTLKISSGLHIPNNSLSFIFELSKALATTAPHLTLEFLKEWTIGFDKGDTPQKTACLHYVAPWLGNLELFSKPSREEGVDNIKHVGEIIRIFISLTVSEKKRLHLSLHEHIWTVLGNGHETLVDIVVEELLHSAMDAGLGSEKAESAADILVSMASMTVRGKVIARLRKTIAQTYLKPSAHLVDNVSWPEICTLARVNLMLAFSPQSSIDTQLFLPELFHIITLLLGAGPVLMRQTVYGLLVNILHSLASTPTSGDMDGPALQHLLRQLQQPNLIGAFGLVQSSGYLELSGKPQKDETDVALLGSVEEVAKFLGNVISAGAVSLDCANAWRARWMGLVAGTCFQHNPATQPQAFTVLGYLAQDDVDDDLVYQIMVAMSTTLSHFTDSNSVLVVSMLRCLSGVIPGLSRDSRYSSTLFWLALSILQLGYIPLFGSALELLITSLKAMDTSGLLGKDMAEGLIIARQGIGEAAKKLDQVCGVSFESNICFSLVAVIFKGIRHPSTRSLTIEALMELLRLSSVNHKDSTVKGEGVVQMIGSSSVAFFVALLPVVASSSADLKAMFAAAGLDASDEVVQNLPALSVFGLLDIPDNSTAVLVVTLVVTILNGAPSDSEKLVLYRFLAEACVEVPEVVAMAYDSLVPKMTAVLATTSNISILTSVTSILEKAMSDPTYTFPTTSSIIGGAAHNESTASLHGKSYSASISSSPSMGFGAREQVLEDLGMKGLGELTFPAVKVERLSAMAKWVASVIESLTI